MSTLRTLGFFVLAGLCEIGGGYLVWLWLRDKKSPLLILPAAILLMLYGVIPTLQTADFGRVYAAYGGVFVVLSVAWGWSIDGIRPDRFDLLGSFVVLVGVALIYFAPRS